MRWVGSRRLFGMKPQVLSGGDIMRFFPVVCDVCRNMTFLVGEHDLTERPDGRWEIECPSRRHVIVFVDNPFPLERELDQCQKQPYIYH